MQNFKKHILPLSYMLSIPILNIFYGLLNNTDRGVSNLTTDLDMKIPFLKVFIIPYIGWYAFMIISLVYLCIKDRKIYYKTLISLDIGLIICYMVYWIYQTEIIRPALGGEDILTKMVALIYKMDQPYNCFPSIHVLTTYLIMKAIGKSQVKNMTNFIVINGLGITIILSTLFVKQHVVLDVFAAMIVADYLFNFVCSLNKERISGWQGKKYSLSTMKKKYEI